MWEILKKILQKQSSGLDIKAQQRDDHLDYDLDLLGGLFRHTPNHTRKIIGTKRIKNQRSQNTCVVESGNVSKEIDEDIELSSQWMAAYLKNKGLMNSQGTSLRAYQQALVEVGAAVQRFAAEEYTQKWNNFARPSILTQESFDNAANHKSKSYWKTTRVDNIIQQIDAGRVGHTALMWYSGYNSSRMRPPWIIEPYSGSKVFGHAVAVIGYDMDYHGVEVLVFQNSYGNSYDKSKFYIKKSDCDSLLKWGTYFNLDLPKDIHSWLSINTNRGVLSKDGPNVYIIQGDRKRKIDNEATMLLYGITPANLVRDEDDLLAQVKQGDDITIKDIPMYKLQEMKYVIQMARDKKYYRELFQPLFPDLF